MITNDQKHTSTKFHCTGRKDFKNGIRFFVRDSHIMECHEHNRDEDQSTFIVCFAVLSPLSERLHIDFRKTGIILWQFISGIEVNSRLIRYTEITMINNSIEVEPSEPGTISRQPLTTNQP